MKVYRLSGDDRYQGLALEDEEFPDFEFDGMPLQELWKPFRVFSENPRLPLPNLFDFPAGLVVDECARVQAATPLEMCGELLPIVFEGRDRERFYFYNVTNCIDVLDKVKSEIDDIGEITQYCFRADRFDERTLFKIPEDGFGSVYVLERTGDWEEEEEFKAIVEHFNLKGLEFEEVWSDGH